MAEGVELGPGGLKSTREPAVVGLLLRLPKGEQLDEGAAGSD